MDDPDLIGMDYLWRVITNASDDIAARAIEIIREVMLVESTIIEFFRCSAWRIGREVGERAQDEC